MARKAKKRSTVKETGPNIHEPPDAASDSQVPPIKVTLSSLRICAMQSDTMAEAESRLGVEDLAERLAKNTRMQAAWDKGRQLRDILALAGMPICMEEASRRLGMGESGLARLYKRDPEVRDMWDRRRVELVVQAKKALQDGAAAGKQHAIAAVEKILAGEFAKGAAETDFTKLTPTQMTDATGYPRQTILRWVRKHGLPRNKDGTYSLAVFLAWLLQFEQDKLTRSFGTAGQDPLREQKARKAKVEADLAEGRVVLKDVFLRTLMTQTAWLVQLLSETTAEEWAALHEGRTALQLKAMYLDAFERLREEWCTCPAEVPMTSEIRAKFEEAFQLMKGESHA